MNPYKEAWLEAINTLQNPIIDSDINDPNEQLSQLMTLSYHMHPAFLPSRAVEAAMTPAGRTLVKVTTGWLF